MSFPLPRIIAHRGAKSFAPENTLSAFKLARAHGASWVEFDVQLTRDEVPVILHDNSLARTSNGAGLVYEQNYADIARLDCGSWFGREFAGETIPTLAQTLDYLMSVNLHANIEIKDAPQEAQNIKTARVVCDLLRRLPAHSCHFLLSSFSFAALTSLRQYAPTAAIGMLLDINDWERDWLQRKGEISALFTELNCDSLNVSQAILTEERIAVLKTVCPRILTYTVNDKYRAAELLNWGVTGVFSDILTQDDL